MHPHRMLKELLTPSAGGSLLYVVITLAVLLGSNLTSLIYQFTIPDNQYYFDKLLHQYADPTFGHLGQTQAIGQITVFLLWASVGAIVYILAWLGLSSYIAVHNDVIIGTTYTSIDTHGHAKYWAEQVARGLFRLCSVLIILLITSLVVQIWYPLSVIMFRIWINDFHMLTNWALMLEALAGWLIILHLLVIFLRLAFLRTRVFS